MFTLEKDAGPKLRYEHLSEIPQDLDVRFTFFRETSKGTITPMFPLVKCKDFLHDAVGSFLTGHEVSLYGFRVDGKMYDINSLIWVATYPVEGQPVSSNYRISKFLKFLNRLEPPNDRTCSTDVSILDHELRKKFFSRAFFFKPSSMWYHSPQTISLLSLLVRNVLAFPSEVKSLREASGILSQLVTQDSTAFKLIHSEHSKITKMLKVAKSGICKEVWEDITKVAVNTFHGYYGVLSFLDHPVKEKYDAKGLKKFKSAITGS